MVISDEHGSLRLVVVVPLVIRVIGASHTLGDMSLLFVVAIIFVALWAGSVITKTGE